MSDCNEEVEAEGEAAGSPDRKDGLHPRWTQDDVIAFACARDYLAELQAVYATALDELMSQPALDAIHEAWLRSELALLSQQRRNLTVRDQAEVAEIRAAFKVRLAAVRPRTESPASSGGHHRSPLD